MPSAQPLSENTIRVAIADDHSLFRQGMRNLLNNLPGIQVVMEAKNGRELIDNIPAFNPEVVLMDLEMPILSGIEATKHLKRLYSSIKVIVLTMHDEELYVRNLMQLGANGYLLKNSEPEEVEKAIRVVSSQEYYYGEFLNHLMQSHLTGKPVPQKNTLTEKYAYNININLTEREIEILKLICTGMTNVEIGEKLHISHRTVDGHRTRLMDKIGARNVTGLVVYAVRYGHF
jgi:two-component system, NarL family, response regulator DegU